MSRWQNAPAARPACGGTRRTCHAEMSTVPWIDGSSSAAVRPIGSLHACSCCRRSRALVVLLHCSALLLRDDGARTRVLHLVVPRALWWRRSIPPNSLSGVSNCLCALGTSNVFLRNDFRGREDFVRLHSKRRSVAPRGGGHDFGGHRLLRKSSRHPAPMPWWFWRRRFCACVT